MTFCNINNYLKSLRAFVSSKTNLSIINIMKGLNIMDMSGINKAAHHPRADVIRFIMKCYAEYTHSNYTMVMDLEELTDEYITYGPEHSAKDPFPSERDLVAALLWLHKNDILYISVDNKISADKEELFVSKLAAPNLYHTVRLNIANNVLSHTGNLFKMA